ncbi:MAG: transposase [Burkholderiaceae bacterium]
MKKKQHSDEKIVAILREATAIGVAAAARKHGVVEQSIYRWRKLYDGMQVSDEKELKSLRDENARLKKLLAERDLEVEVMKEIQAKKW